MHRIASGDYEVGLDPDTGGGIAFLRWRGRDVLRPAASDAKGPLDLSCFPLVPYANRIASGRFRWRGRTVSLTPNMAGDPSPLHGDGWKTAWSVSEAAADRIVLEMRREAGEWPWAHAADLTVSADAGGVQLELEVINLSEEVMPAGLGFHPYFPGRATGRLRTHVQAVWLTDKDLLPVRLAPAEVFGDWAAGEPVSRQELIDNCYTGWRGQADIWTSEDGPKVRLTASPNLRWLQVYSPPGQEFFCVEPVSHRPDALNAEDPKAEGVTALDPGVTLAAWIRLEAS